jgi:hypothetical protein
MRFWVYGVDRTSKQPRDPLFLEADSEEAARAAASAEGMQVEEVEVVRPRAEPPPAPPPPVEPPPVPSNPRPATGTATSREQLRDIRQLCARLAGKLRRGIESFGFRLLVGSCLVAILVLAVQIHSHVSELRPPRPGQESRWEYKVVETPDSPTPLANAVSEANRQGWEVVGVASSVESVFDRVRTKVLLILRRRL